MESAQRDLPIAPEAPRHAFWTRALMNELATIVVLTTITLLFSSHFRSTFFNNYTRMADAWLQGHMWIDWPGRVIDAAEWKGQHYGIDGPFPALLMIPSVIIYGSNANETTVAIFTCVVAIALAWALLVRLGVERFARLWLILFLFAGTDMWWCAQLGDVWFMAHTTCVALIFGALLESVGRRRGWVIGLLVVAAIESRFSLIGAVPFFAYLIWSGDLAKQAVGTHATVDVRNEMRWYAGMLGLGVAVWIGYNELMWGLPYDIGHWLYYHQDSWGQPYGSPFNINHLPYQIYSFFMRPPVLVEWLQQAQWPIFKVDMNGIALTFTSPALVLAFFAKAPKRLLWAIWITVALIATPDFLYYLNGWYQFGMRHALDFEPFLLVLMAFAVRRSMPVWGAALCAYSALVGAWGVWWWNTFIRQTY